MIPALDKTAAKPLYKQLGDALLEKIHNGEMLPHEKLPAIRALAASLHVNNTTVVAAYKYMEKNRAVYSILGSGTFVAQTESTSDTHRLISAQKKISDDCINFLSLATCPKLFPEADFRRAFDEVLAKDGAGAFSFPGAGGFAPLREIIREIFCTDFKKITPRNIQIIQNTNDGLEMLADALISPGDAVLTETPCAPDAETVFASRGAKILKVPLGKNGLDLKKIYFFVKKFRPKMFVLTPNYQMPTSLCYTETEKMRVLELARNSNAYIIEMNSHGDFFYNDKPSPLKALDEDNRHVIYLKGLDRVLAPGLAGFLACPDEIIGRLGGFGGVSGYIQRGLGVYLKNYGFEAHLEALRKEYFRKYRKAVAAAKAFFPPDSFAESGGGVGLWVKSDVRGTDEFLARKVLVAPGSYFSVGDEFFRLNFASVTDDEISRGIGIIASVLNGR